MRIRKLACLAVVLLALGYSSTATSTPVSAAPTTSVSVVGTSVGNGVTLLSSIPDPFDVALIFRVHTGDAVQHYPYSSICSMNANAVVYGEMYKHDLAGNWHYRIQHLWADGHWDNFAPSAAAWNDTCPGPA